MKSPTRVEAHDIPMTLVHDNVEVISSYVFWVYVNKIPVHRTNNYTNAYVRYNKEMKSYPHKLIEVKRVKTEEALMISSIPVTATPRNKEDVY